MARILKVDNETKPRQRQGALWLIVLLLIGILAFYHVEVQSSGIETMMGQGTQRAMEEQEERPPRKIFIDLGANCGNSYQRIKNGMTKGSDETLSTPEWEAYLWECNPQLIDWFLRDLIEQEGPKVHLVPKAASTETGQATFFMTSGQEGATSKEQLPNPTCDPKSRYQPGGASTLYGNAHRAGKNVTVNVENFLEWHKTLGLRTGDTVHMKMDIEGAELGIIEQFLDDETNQICYWDAFWVEYHKLIFKPNTEDYLTHERFENELPSRFEQKCGRKLWPNVYG